MVMRPVFLPKRSRTQFVLEAMVEFQWHAGFSTTQKQKSIASLHQSAAKRFVTRSPLEVSSKSPSPLGVALSAFNLQLQLGDGRGVPVEVAFQSSKKFTRGGPYLDLLAASPKDAKRDLRLQESGQIEAFVFGDESWALTPRTAFYDWLYLNALNQHPHLGGQLLEHDVFTDIEFNPERSINCQARSCALYVSLVREKLFEEAMQNKRSYLAILDHQTAIHP